MKKQDEHVITHLVKTSTLSNIAQSSYNFLALLDYVSRAHGIAICPSSVVRRPSVRVAIISELNARISFKF